MSNHVDLSPNKLHPRVRKKELNRERQEEMIQPNSDKSFLV